MRQPFPLYFGRRTDLEEPTRTIHHSYRDSQKGEIFTKIHRKR
jgi:hypothetical protein